MTDLYLIAHLVRSTPAFDIATKMSCPLCSTHDPFNNTWVDPQGCGECDEEGFWWIVPTSGHRAYPYWSQGLWDLSYMWDDDHHSILQDIPPPPSDWPDHYLIRASPTSPKSSLADLITKSLATSTATASPIRRRV